MGANKKKLTDKQEMFCQEYIVDLNATQAAIRSGYSEKSAKEIGYEHLTKPHIADRIAELKKERVEKTQISSQAIVQELINWIWTDYMEFMEVKPSEYKNMPAEKRRLVSGWKRVWRKEKKEKGEHEDVEYVELQFVSKEKAMEMLTRHVGIYEVDNQQQKQDTAPRITINHSGGNIDLSM